MNRAGMWFVAGLLGAAVAGAESPATESQMTVAMLAELRQLRQDLQTATATIQRVQIVMFRLQAQGTLVESARQRLETAQSICSQAPLGRQMTAMQIERTEAQRRSAQNPAEQRQAEEMLAQLRSQMEFAAKREQECQAPQAEAETEFRNEEAKMNELQERLERLDKTLADYGRK